MSRFSEESYQCRRPKTRAELRLAGVGRRTLAGPGYQRTARGHHRLADAPDTRDSATQRIIDAVPHLPPGGLTAGWAAAYIHGVNLLDGLHHLTLEPLPVPILLPPGQRRRDTATITYRQSSRPIKGTVVANIPVTTSWRALFDLTVQAPDLTEAVVAADAFLAARVTTRETLQRNIDRTPSRRGIQRARMAITLARVGVLSTWESRLRMVATLDVGLTELHPNRAVFDPDGVLLGIPDLLDVEAALALEYDGVRCRAGDHTVIAIGSSIAKTTHARNAWNAPVSLSYGPRRPT